MASNRVRALTDKLNEYVSAKNSYINKLNTYNDIVNQVMLNRKANDTSVSNSGDLVTTSQNVKMKTSSNTTAGYDDSLDSTDNSFKSALPWQGLDDMNNTYSDIVIQNNLTGMNTIAAHDDATAREYIIPTDSNDNEIDPDITQNTDCTLKFFKKCDGVAKMKNNNKFGLTRDDDGNNCFCYTTDKSLTRSTSSYVVGSPSSGFGDVHYLGIMMNGKVYQLKRETYHENFNDLYEVNATNAVELNVGLPEDDLNPFTGIYINDLNIISLGITNCE